MTDRGIIELLDTSAQDDFARFLGKWWPANVSNKRRPMRGIVVLCRPLKDNELVDLEEFIAELPAGGAWVQVLRGDTSNGLPIRIFLNPMRCCSIEIRFQKEPKDIDNQLTIVLAREDHDQIFISKMRSSLEALAHSEHYTVDLEALKAAVMAGFSNDHRTH